MKYLSQMTSLSLLLFLIATSADAQHLLDINFNNDAAIAKLEAIATGVAVGKSDGQTTCLIIAAGGDVQSLKPIQIQQLQKYKLTIRAAIDAADTIEINDRLSEFSRIGLGKHLAGCELHFFDKDGDEVAFSLQRKARAKPLIVPVVSRKFHDYVAVFYAPPLADTLRIDLTSRQRKLLIESIDFQLETEERTFNCNPDFRYGELNLTGWAPDREGRLFRRPDGVTVLRSGARANSTPFVVDEKLRYSFFCKGVGYEKQAGKVIVQFYGEKGSQLGHTHLFWSDDMRKGATKPGIQPLPGSKFATIEASNVILEHVHVTRDR